LIDKDDRSGIVYKGYTSGLIDKDDRSVIVYKGDKSDLIDNDDRSEIVLYTVGVTRVKCLTRMTRVK
jgi:hypothetical protein